MTVAILLASLGCSNPIEVKERETAVLAVRAISPPVARRFFFPPAAPQELWAVDFEVEIRETRCVAANLTFVEIQVFAIGVDEHGHGIGIDTSVESALQVVQ